MATVDFRTRLDGDVDLLDPVEFLEDRLPPLLDASGRQAGVAATRLELVPLTLDVEGQRLTMVPEDDALDLQPGGDAALFGLAGAFLVAALALVALIRPKLVEVRS